MKWKDFHHARLITTLNVICLVPAGVMCWNIIPTNLGPNKLTRQTKKKLEGPCIMHYSYERSSSCPEYIYELQLADACSFSITSFQACPPGQTPTQCIARCQWEPRIRHYSIQSACIKSTVKRKAIHVIVCYTYFGINFQYSLH